MAERWPSAQNGGSARGYQDLCEELAARYSHALTVRSRATSRQPGCLRRGPLLPGRSLGRSAEKLVTRKQSAGPYLPL